MHINNNSKILIIAAHPDDEVLAMGGSIAKFKEMGAEITVKFLGEGVSARFSREDIGSQEFIRQTEIRKNGAVNALNYLGVENVIFGERLCCRFDGLEILLHVEDERERLFIQIHSSSSRVRVDTSCSSSTFLILWF